jgi:SnoaL-like protein
MSQESMVVRGVRTKIPPLSEASDRRILEERLFVRFPALFRLFTYAWMRLPPRSRLRRYLLTRLVSRACAAANRRDFALLVGGVDSAVEHRPAKDLMPLDWDPVAYGRDGYQQVWRKMLDAFDDFHAEPAEVLDLGDRILVTARYKGHGSASGVPIEETLFQVSRFRRGLVIWQQDFTDISEALEAAGLRE